MNWFKKKKGIGLTGMIVILGIVAFTAAVTVPKFVNKGNLTRQKDIQAEASAILKDAKTYVNQSDLPSFGLPINQELTEEVFNSLEVTKVMNLLNAKGALNGINATNLTVNNPNINLGNLKVITNVPAKNIILDGNGNLVTAPYIMQEK
ncbi:MAG: hypothetical protein ACRCWM_11085 [Sarcina sp.]